MTEVSQPLNKCTAGGAPACHALKLICPHASRAKLSMTTCRKWMTEALQLLIGHMAEKSGHKACRARLSTLGTYLHAFSKAGSG